jgi:LemA protein
VAAARSAILGAKGPADTAKADNQFQQTMKSLFAVAENYPDLKASQNFQELQGELTDTEDKIQASRRFYNAAVRDFNTKRKTFPTKIFARRLGYTQDKEFFDVADSERATVEQPVAVKF